MVTAVLSSLIVSLDAQTAALLESSIQSDAILKCTNLPDTSGGDSFLALLRKVTFCYTEYTDADGAEGTRVRILHSDYEALRSYITGLFTPAWAGITSSSGTMRASAFSSNNLEMVAWANGTSPGNFHTSTHGCLSDVHVGYLTAALTGNHDAQSFIINEHAIFDTLAAEAFGDSVMCGLFNDENGDLNSVDVDGSQYYEVVVPAAATMPMQQLLFYLSDAGRFAGFTADAVAKPFETLPLESGDTISFKVSIGGSLSLGTTYLTGSAASLAVQSLATVSSTAHASPATFAKPIDHDAGGGVGSSANITLTPDGSTVAAGAVVSTPLRTQAYEMHITLGAPDGAGGGGGGGGGAAQTTQYFIVGYNSSYASNNGKLTLFTQKIDEINAALPQNENPWVLASPSTPEKRTALLAALDAWGAALKEAFISGADTTTLGWYPEQDTPQNTSYSANVVGTIDSSADSGDDSIEWLEAGGFRGLVYIALTRPTWDSGDWVFGDGTVLAHADAAWENGPTQTPYTENVTHGNQATIYPSGGEYGNTYSANNQAGKFRGYNPWATPATAIFERLA